MNEITESAPDPNKDDLPLMANVGSILVRHYVLDLTVNFDRKVISGTIVLYLEINKTYGKIYDSVGTGCCPYSQALFETEQPGSSCNSTASIAASASVDKIYNLSKHSGGRVTNVNNCNHSNTEWTSGISGRREHCSNGDDFVLVLDCCDLVVNKVEEVNVTATPGIERLIGIDTSMSKNKIYSQRLQNDVQSRILDAILGLGGECWQEQHCFYLECSKAPGCGELQFQTDRWSLQIKKLGIQTPKDFPRVLRIYYETKPEGGSVRWTKDQSGRPCVYTSGSPINNRALFPCQEPPEAMATWQASVWAPKGSLVLMSGENCAEPKYNGALSNWFYYVTMHMPASTFTIAVGYWVEVVAECSFRSQTLNSSSSSSSSNYTNKSSDSLLFCGHPAYPCRFQNFIAQAQNCIPYRVFAPECLKVRSQEVLLPLVAQCLSAAHCVLGTHPFSRVDVLIVPASFSSLGMASPHIIFLSQSVLSGKQNLCGIRLCHEIAHAWFGLAIGARDWTEEWISEGFATYLEDVFWANAQKLSEEAAKEQQQLKSLLRWRRLRDEILNSEEELQVLRPNKQNTGAVSDSGSTIVKHGLNAGKSFMQVHYLKGYFVLHYLENRVGQKAFLKFFRLFVERFHGQLILSQDFLHMFMENFSELRSQGLSMEVIFENWLDVAGIPKPLLDETLKWTENRLVCEVQSEVTKWIKINKKDRKGSCKRKRSQKDEVTFKELLPDQLVLLLELLLEVKSFSFRTLQLLQKHYCLREQDAEVRHRWYELVIKHKHTVAYRDLINFLEQHQAMGVYLYGELMVNEDAKQQHLVHRCFTKLQEEMDPSLQKVIAEMIL
ncbi:aminopeptidase O isoform X1 [Hemiscyllium ocellatum]|uniref:aminopeptidase O isoform X1 n=1 Tax=Hemiscyllium ocellatum TaxID=170820 RepID=UPI002965D0B1|nr:aminopeptidase O isoform X1 [Hemiscyllium ocellatum]XP_060694345.1 aminopeptidase O isoform X1 [Hemiscyllium ocellatum]